MNNIFKDETIIITEYFNIGQDREIPIPGFFIIAPNRKLKSIDELTDNEASELINLTRQVRKGMRDALNIQEVCFYQDESASNYHLRLFPRLDRMENFGHKIQSIRPIMERAKENMMDEETFTEVRLYVEKMRLFFNNYKNKL